MAGPAQRAPGDDARFAGLAKTMGRAPRILLLSAPYYRDIADALEAGARAELALAAAEVSSVEVAGALELPQALDIVLDGPRGDGVDGVVVIGCVIRGETSHYDIVCETSNHWLMEVALRHGVPIGNALLTVDTHDQAVRRAEGGRAGKGGDAARACLALIELSHRNDRTRTEFKDIEV
ncbi:MAG: 6,7-dimethyl-8-ribityllumazine synthase [Hyphomicrobiaceae bacterium]